VDKRKQVDNGVNIFAFTRFPPRAIVLAPQNINFRNFHMTVLNSQLFEAEQRRHSHPLTIPSSPGEAMPPQLWNSPAVPASAFQSWWIHLWSGLVRDSTGKHQKTMGNAVWLYLYLLISANRSDGVVLRRQETIAAQTGLSERSVARWMQELREKGYVETTTNGRSLRIQITKWRPIVGSRQNKH